MAKLSASGHRLLDQLLAMLASPYSATLEEYILALRMSVAPDPEIATKDPEPAPDLHAAEETRVPDAPAERNHEQTRFGDDHAPDAVPERAERSELVGPID